jgi:dihydroorotate dehydrogenase electron transfer subunit
VPQNKPNDTKQPDATEVRPRDAGVAPGITPQLVSARVLERRAVGSSYHLLTFESATPVPAYPGHFAMVRSSAWGTAPLLARPMSLLAGGARPAMLIKVVGEATRRMAESAPGEQYSLLGPLGRPWTPPAEATGTILVAGGVGVAPLLFLARAIAETRPDKRPVALYGGRTASDLPLCDELAAVADLSVSTEDGSRGLRGRVTALLEARLRESAQPPTEAKVYTCGPLAMMAAVARICERVGMACEVSLEAPMACGYGVCLGCPVPRQGDDGYLHACTEGPCVDAARIDWDRAMARHEETQR